MFSQPVQYKSPFAFQSRMALSMVLAVGLFITMAVIVPFTVADSMFAQQQPYDLKHYGAFSHAVKKEQPQGRVRDRQSRRGSKRVDDHAIPHPRFENVAASHPDVEVPELMIGEAGLKRNDQLIVDDGWVVERSRLRVNRKEEDQISYYPGSSWSFDDLTKLETYQTPIVCTMITFVMFFEKTWPI